MCLLFCINCLSAGSVRWFHIAFLSICERDVSYVTHSWMEFAARQETWSTQENIAWCGERNTHTLSKRSESNCQYAGLYLLPSFPLSALFKCCKRKTNHLQFLCQSSGSPRLLLELLRVPEQQQIIKLPEITSPVLKDVLSKASRGHAALKSKSERTTGINDHSLEPLLGKLHTYEWGDPGPHYFTVATRFFQILQYINYIIYASLLSFPIRILVFMDRK